MKRILVFFFFLVSFLFSTIVSAQRTGGYNDAQRHQGIAKSGRGHCGASPRRNAISYVTYSDVKKPKKHNKNSKNKKKNQKNKKKSIAKRGKK